ncbi:hypothetical protein PIB30_024611 [Stylosanthes scabra]|uniref:Uncharacterized protein n=1 Tax=Stylosanthes scabra TaxID=79078 RepID=A0ABU6VBB2_9FABA|nr:hypothetical protein [Stylosanthes scabra]
MAMDLGIDLEVQVGVMNFDGMVFHGQPMPTTIPAAPHQGLARAGSKCQQGGEKMDGRVVNAGVGSSQVQPSQFGSGSSSVVFSSGSTGDAYVSQTQGGGFLMVEDMEVYLMRACVNLVMGCPVFEPRWFISPQGERMVGYDALLRCEEKGVYLQVESSYCGDDGRARQEAAYLLLDQLLRRTGYSICDFNYRRLCEAEE